MSDLIIFGCYVAIPFVLGLFWFRKRRRLPFPHILLCFGGFILFCGLGHLMDFFMTDWPAYRLYGLVKVLTAISSAGTLVCLFRVVPTALRLQTPGELEATVKERTEMLAVANSGLEEAARRQERVIAQMRMTMKAAKITSWVWYRDDGRVELTNGGDNLVETIDAGEAWSRVHPDDLATLRRAIDEAVEAGPGSSYMREIRYTQPGQEQKWMEAHGMVAAGNQSVLYGIMKDVTWRKNIEQGLRERAEEQESLLNMLPVVVLTSRDPHCTKIVGNRFAQRTLGLGDEENMSKSAPIDEQPPFRVFAGGVEIPPEQMPMQLAASTGKEVFNYEQTIVFTDGREDLTMLGSAVPLFDAEGHVRGVVGAMLDITHRKKIEAERIRQIQELEARDAGKDEFVAMLAHELRNPLNPITTAVQVLRMTADASRREKMALTYEMIERQVGHMSRILDDLLDLARVSRGKVVLQKERLEWTALVRHSIEATTANFRCKQHRVTIDDSCGPVWVYGDPVRLQQVVVNLVTNACKYTDAGGDIVIRITKDGGRVITSVTDNGMGIPAALLGRVFEMFHQGMHDRTRQAGGLGVGLTVVKRLTEMHAGTVAVSSEGEGKGSTFTLNLPASEPPAREDRQTPSSEWVPGKVLIIDDSLDSAGILAQLLTLHGCEVQTACDGPSGIEVCKAFQPHLILLDIGLPRMSGHEVCKKLRQDGCGTVIVACTGYGTEEDRRESLLAGFDLHLVKPIEPQKLFQHLAEARSVRGTSPAAK